MILLANNAAISYRGQHDELNKHIFADRDSVKSRREETEECE